jgi:transposase
MPQENYIAQVLDMEGIEIIHLNATANELEIEFRLKRREHVCPVCKGVTDQVHDYRVQTVKDLPIQGKKVLWRYHKRRYRCECCAKRFAEVNYLLPRYHRIANRMAAYGLTELSKKQSNQDIAQRLGVSASTIGRWLRLLNFKPPRQLPAVVAIDEFRGNAGGEKFQCILTAPTRKAVIDILPSRKSHELIDYLKRFENRKAVQYVVKDMSLPYFEISRALFPHAKIVIDRFHVVRYCTWALENVRKRVQKGLPTSERKYFKRSRKLLLSHMHKLSSQNKQAVERMLLVSRDLREAYLLKEVFYKFMRAENAADAKKILSEFRLHAAIAEIPEFKACLTMLQNWEPYILNAFDCPFSNGFTEGINNSIKVIKRIAYGFRSFENFRLKILHTCNSLGG